ncbi:hypothetical protein CY34DRAFT_545075 [Suillus luteus UH-Slu-Lm8-n1]|uniref:Uncharacterized protein n=1 Tax=Suillus luteus UH-Slu-Lm8-n1 TaxID=930992 RepID=A0A0C9ZF03_9AGAM|nr:hypothetical protein CY34DRAFT_545075 [Suillus luteus UH-Slu-Lm8-n1]
MNIIESAICIQREVPRALRRVPNRYYDKCSRNKLRPFQADIVNLDGYVKISMVEFALDKYTIAHARGFIR